VSQSRRRSFHTYQKAVEGGEEGYEHLRGGVVRIECRIKGAEGEVEREEACAARESASAK